MPLRLLRAAGERLQLGKQLRDHAEIHRDVEADRRLSARTAASRIRPRRARAADRRAGSGGRARRSPRSSVKPKRAANCTARSTRRLSSPNVCGSTTRSSRRSRSRAAVERIEVLAGQRIPGDGVDGEVAPARRLGDRHVRIAGDDEAAVAASRLRIAPRQRHVDVADLVDLKAFADRFDAAERLEQRAQTIAGEAEDLEVDVARLGQAEQPIADPAADDQRAAAGVADGGGDRCGPSSIVMSGSGEAAGSGIALSVTSVPSGPACGRTASPCDRRSRARAR